MQGTSLANGTEKHAETDWNTIDWHQEELRVRNLRQRIFRATQAGDWKRVRSLQKLMLRSRANALVGVRRVAQRNAGKKTPGVDKVLLKTPAARGRMVDLLMLHQTWATQPARRVYISKANGKQRPLGIPVMLDRCVQAMVKNALEPSWEARFEGCSYGFRPGRGCQDAIERIYRIASPKNRKKWVLDADIKGAFDNISHEYMLLTIGRVPGCELIKQWLKAGYVDKGVFHETGAGTPQGGVISPLLANIALHGMEEALEITHRKNGQLNSKRALVRYADDFCVFCESQEDAERAKQILTVWLSERGLTLSPEKTKIVHLTEGFNFLGFNIRHYKVSNTRTGWKLLTKPSKEAVQKHREKIKQEWDAVQGWNGQKILWKLNPIIRGWANYYRTGVAKETFNKLDNWMFYKEVRHVKRTHPHKPKKWHQAKYWGKLNLDRQDLWVFGDKQTGLHLLKYRWFSIERHILVKGTASPDDPTLKDYWQKRNATHVKDLSPSRQHIARKQHGICPECRNTLFNDEELHVHHRIPKAQGGKNDYGNLVLVHSFCHQKIHAGKDVKDELSEVGSL
jgi:RNA-directed DNA polymerase